jgi:O-antigen ligase
MVIVASVTLVNARGTHTEAFKVYASHGNVQLINRPTLSSSDLVLNGRIGAWQAALGKNPAGWLFGRGVGKVGTAAQRASSAFIPTSGTAKGQSRTQATAVDSGYIATVADVGLVGLAVMLALFGRLIGLGIRYARRNIIAGWVALAFTACMMLDALTRASFTGFPTAFIGLLLVGIALAAGAEDLQASRSSSHSPAS